ncbi:MAG: sugar ABC transporter permease, partial [Protaetiibacter sp.]
MTDVGSSQAADTLSPAAHFDPTSAARDRRRSGGWRARERRLAGAVGSVALLPFAGFALVPVAYVLVISFTRYNGVRDPTWVGLHNYQLAFADSSWWLSVVNTLVLAAGSIAIELPLSLLLAVLLNRAVRWTSGFRTIFFLPHVISIAVMGVIFYFILRPINGILNGLLKGIGVISADVDWLGSAPTAMAALIVVSVWSGFGINTIFFLVGLQT